MAKKIKMHIVDPEEMTRDVQGLLDIDPSGALFCQVLHALNEFLHALVTYAGNESSEQWLDDVQRLSDRFSDYMQYCGTQDIEALNEVYVDVMSADPPLINDVWHLANMLGYTTLSKVPKADRAEARQDWHEYLRDAIVDFWSNSGGRGAKRFAAIGDWFRGKKEEADQYIDKKSEEATRGAAKSIREEVVDPVVERFSQGAKNVGLGLAIGLGAGILIWLAYTGTKTAGKVAAVATPQGRAASAALGGGRY